MKNLVYLFLVTSVALAASCRTSHIGDGNNNNIADAGPQPSYIGTPCTEDGDCSPYGLQCVQPMGASQPGLCTVLDCEASGCPEGAQCVVLGIPGLPSLCTPGTQSTDACQTQCGTPLKCSLEPRCFDLGCCGQEPCPPHCGTLTLSDCTLDGRCPADCCTQ